MPETTIDLAAIALNVSSPCETAGPGSTGICQGKSPFDKSLNEVMSTTVASGEISSSDIEQVCHLHGKSCHQTACFIDGIQEVRALADAIFKSSSGFANKNGQLLISGTADTEPPLRRLVLLPFFRSGTVGW